MTVNSSLFSWEFKAQYLRIHLTLLDIYKKALHSYKVILPLITITRIKINIGSSLKTDDNESETDDDEDSTLNIHII
ncbi:hypothetical protein RIR_jg26973.t1 [Rhizophagus irregularis DAOM 181602=DAOM 197198]|nr:hypothetical protein RIR_jg26973.t1 [Rhizophagus irregularis DAOM 181602=DAOM 197198]